MKIKRRRLLVSATALNKISQMKTTKWTISAIALEKLRQV